jgi:hypothetical protein
MKPEPLKGKERNLCNLMNESLRRNEHSDYTSSVKLYQKEDLKSAVAGLIKFHEDRIEELIKEWCSIDIFIDRYEGESNLTYKQEIEREYESIMAIEHWLEDVI